MVERQQDTDEFRRALVLAAKHVVLAMAHPDTEREAIAKNLRLADHALTAAEHLAPRPEWKLRQLGSAPSRGYRRAVVLLLLVIVLVAALGFVVSELPLP